MGVCERIIKIRYLNQYFPKLRWNFLRKKSNKRKRKALNSGRSNNAQRETEKRNPKPLSRNELNNEKYCKMNFYLINYIINKIKIKWQDFKNTLTQDSWTDTSGWSTKTGAGICSTSQFPFLFSISPFSDIGQSLP